MASIFIRERLEQQPGDFKAGISGCPDIIFNGRQVEGNLSKFTSDAGYNSDFGSTVYIQEANYVYLRGKNISNQKQASRMYFYFTESNLLLWPKNWRGDCMTVAGISQNWSQINFNDPNSVAATPQPILWTPPPLTLQDHYCVILWADDSPPPLEQWGQLSDIADLSVLLQKNPGMGWRNTCDVQGTPPNYTYPSKLTIGEGGGSINISVKFINIPLDGTFSINIQGTDESNTINLIDQSLSGYKGGYNVSGLSYPSNFESFIKVDWYRGATLPPPSAQVKVFVTIDATGPLIKRFNDAGIATEDIQIHLFNTTYALPHQKGKTLTPTPVVIAGNQTWNMKGN